MTKKIEALSKDGRARMSIPTSGLTKEQIKQVKGWKKKIKKSGLVIESDCEGCEEYEERLK